MKFFMSPALVAGLTFYGGIAAADSISPDSYSDTLAVGDSVTITKTVTVDAGTLTTGLVDIFFLSDTTGSMGGFINTVRNNANKIFTGTQGFGDVAWGVGEFKDFPTSDWGGSSDFPWRLNQAITTDTAAVTVGLGQWSASGGSDGPESGLHALSQAATLPEVGWRAGSNRFVVWFGDVGSHDPVSCAVQGIVTCTAPAAPLSSAFTGSLTYPGPTITETIADLDNAGITVFGVGSSGFDRWGQVSTIANATGGDVFLGGDPGDTIADLIKTAVEDSFASYSSVTLSPEGNLPGVNVAWSPLFDTGAGPWTREEARTFDFEVTFTGATAGSHDFVINALVDGGIVATEKDSITVTGDGGPAPIPLPAGLPMLLGALGLMGAAAHRRKR